MKRRVWIGSVTQQGAVFLAECGRCTWRLRKRDLADAEALLKSHNRIAHPRVIPVYLEEAK